MPARADLPLELAPGATCLTADALQERIAGWLDVPVSEAGSIEQASGEWLEVRGSMLDPRSVLVVLHQPDGTTSTRSFEPGPERCPDLHEAVALAATLLIRAASGLAPARPNAASRPPPPLAADTPEAVPGPAVALPLPAGDAVPRPAPVRLEGELALSAAFATQVGASLSGGGRAQLGLRVLPRLDLRIGGLLLVSRGEPLATGRGAYAHRLTSAAAEGCARWLTSAAMIGRLCAGFAAGQQKLEGSGYQPNLSSELRWLSLTGGPELAVAAVGDLWIFLAAALVVPLESTEVTLVDVDGERLATSSSPALGLALFVGLSYRIAAAH